MGTSLPAGLAMLDQALAATRQTVACTQKQLEATKAWSLAKEAIEHIKELAIFSARMAAAWPPHAP